VARIGDDAPAGRAGEAPARAGNRLRRPVELIADEQHRVALLEIGGRMREVAAVGEQEVLDALGRLEIDVDPPAQRPAVGVQGLRRVEAVQPGQLRHVALPAARDDDVAAPHQEPVAGVERGIRIGVGPEDRPGGVVEVRHGHRVAAVDDVHDRAPAGAAALDRQQDRHVGGELDAAVAAGREADVRDRGVGRVRGIDGEAQAALQLLVGADVAERAAPGQRSAQREVEVGHRHP
jgi:hypothetical protein